ncbi:MAG: phosphatase PAP2 family protein [Chloroflexi bacterium]|nr:MAG: phosphatase PAP2 family protein [Chloroflexota bacterium]
MDDNRPAGEQGSKNAVENESLGERLQVGTERVAGEVQQEVTVAEERIGAGTERVVEEARQEVAAARRPWYQTKKWGSVLLIVYAALLVVFGLLAWWVASHPVLAIDIKITRAFQDIQAPWLQMTMIAVSYLGNMLLLLVGLIALAAVLFWILGLRLEAITIVVVSATSAIIDWAIKLIVARPRPSASLVEVLQAASGSSFTSAHVMSYVAFWGLLFSFGIILFRGHSWWRIALLIISALFVVLVGPSRVYLGDHWTSDVLGSYLLGGILLGVALWIYLYLKGKNVLASRGKMTEGLRKYVRR